MSDSGTFKSRHPPLFDMTELLDGEALAAEIREGLVAATERLTGAGARPTLATVLMSDDPASETYVSMKQDDCAEVGIEARDVELDPEAPATELYETIDELNADPDVDGVLVQMPVPGHVDKRRVLRSVTPGRRTSRRKPAEPTSSSPPPASRR